MRSDPALAAPSTLDPHLGETMPRPLRHEHVRRVELVAAVDGVDRAVVPAPGTTAAIDECRRERHDRAVPRGHARAAREVGGEHRARRRRRRRPPHRARRRRSRPRRLPRAGCRRPRRSAARASPRRAPRPRGAWRGSRRRDRRRCAGRAPARADAPSAGARPAPACRGCPPLGSHSLGRRVPAAAQRDARLLHGRKM